ncbi:MAG: SGNH/GDSL hydrolase family protein, partial [Bdellovibrionales bacterium]|nr:SGNH/GDSL hydrolase family protein [Bdellovibrionales bacterium]
SGVFELGPQRQIKLLEPIESNENLNRLKIQLDPQESKKFLLSLNSNLSIEIQKTSLDKTFITLRSGEHDVEVYRLSIRGENSFYSEDFAPPPSFSMILFFILLITGTAFLLWRKNKREFKFASHAFALSLPLFTFSLTLIFLDQKYYVSKYYYKGYTPHNRFSDKGEVADFENFRSRLFFTYKKELPKIPTPAPGLEKTLGIESDLSHHKRESIEWMNTQNGSQQFKKIFHLQKEAHSHPDVLFFGASQTWGAGAPQNQKSWTNLLLSKISDQVKRPVTGLNIAACGTTTLSAKPNLTQALEVTSPAIVLLNIGINDDRIYPDEVYAKELNEIIDQIESNGALPIFSLEPDNFETRNGATLRSHEIIRSIAREREIPLIDSRGHFLSPHVRDSGLLFWDIVHFDSWGHHTMANFIFESYPWAQRLKVQ